MSATEREETSISEEASFEEEEAGEEADVDESTKDPVKNEDPDVEDIAEEFEDAELLEDAFEGEELDGGKELSESSKASEFSEEHEPETIEKPAPGRANPQQPIAEERAASSGEMTQIFVRYGKEQHTVKADLDDKIAEIKKQLEKLTGLPIAKQHLIYNSFKNPFKDDKSLRYYRCLKGANFTLTAAS